MKAYELQISNKDWVYISLIGTLFGFFISLFFYFLNEIFSDISTIGFGVFSGLSITLFSSIFITISNDHILPKLNKRFWYLISFGFSFLSGALGFLCSYSVFYVIETKITDIIEPYSLYLTLTVGSLTFLIGLILHQFISMKYKNESIKNEILDSKLKALENELNPHFLFNALNSMSELVYQDQQKAEKSILNLSKFLRSAINRESLIDVKDELAMVRTYVEIENIRFEDKIKLHISNNIMTNIQVPKFSIQLLVENAIKHGYENKELNIDIDIDIDQNITVSNDGKRTEKLKFGTGLSNLNNRLKLLNIGTLNYKNGDKMMFTIKLNGK
ncbi:MAG: histidine kinase [Campylobacterota bacterium]|nr:histidine kinase [Campylobacterota bacterium]